MVVRAVQVVVVVAEFDTLPELLALKDETQQGDSYRAARLERLKGSYSKEEILILLLVSHVTLIRRSPQGLQIKDGCSFWIQ